MTLKFSYLQETNASKQHLNIFVSKSSCKCGHVQSKEPEMVETPLPYNWSPVHDYEWGQVCCMGPHCTLSVVLITLSSILRESLLLFRRKKYGRALGNQAAT